MSVWKLMFYMGEGCHTTTSRARLYVSLITFVMQDDLRLDQQAHRVVCRVLSCRIGLRLLREIVGFCKGESCAVQRWCGSVRCCSRIFAGVSAVGKRLACTVNRDW